MQAKHTAGPWYHSVADNTVWSSPEVCAVAAVLEVADGSDDPEAVDAEQMEANARLIAAAPDMYEALRTALDAFSPNSTRHVRNADAINTIEDALAKAEGR